MIMGSRDCRPNQIQACTHTEHKHVELESGLEERQAHTHTHTHTHTRMHAHKYCLQSSVGGGRLSRSLPLHHPQNHMLKKRAFSFFSTDDEAEIQLGGMLSR